MSLDDYYLDDHDELLAWKIDGKVIKIPNRKELDNLIEKKRAIRPLTNEEVERFNLGDYNPVMDFSQKSDREIQEMEHAILSTNVDPDEKSDFIRPIAIKI